MNAVWIDLRDIEAAIQWWQLHIYAEDTAALKALIQIKTQMILQGIEFLEESAMSLEALAAFERWLATLPDSPCIAICSTSVGDNICTGCGRSFEEITRWTVMTPIEKRSVWKRITQQATSLRFTPEYADRLIEKSR